MDAVAAKPRPDNKLSDQYMAAFKCLSEGGGSSMSWALGKGAADETGNALRAYAFSPAMLFIAADCPV